MLAVVFACATFVAAAAASTKPSDLPACDATQPQLYTLCSMPPGEVHPTQPMLGFAEVSCKINKFNGMSNSDLNSYLMDHPVPAVAGLGRMYITDHHHLSAALHMSTVDEDHKLVVVNVTTDMSSAKTPSSFFSQLLQHSLVWLYDNRFNQPLDPRLLPDTVDLMGNDLYRSLAYFVRCNGGYQKLDTPYQDFYWAQYFHTLNLLPAAPAPPSGNPVTSWGACEAMPFNVELGCQGYTDSIIGKALPAAMKAAADSTASSLPGFGPTSGVVCSCPTP